MADEYEADTTSQSRPIEELEVSVSTSEALVKAGIKTIAELLAKTENDLERLHFTKKAIFEIREILGMMGLTLSPD